MLNQAHRWVTALVILISASGCDNVGWAPPTFELVPPPSRAPEEVEVEVEPPEPELGLPEGPVLYMGSRNGDSVTVVPIAEFRGDTLLPIAPLGPEGYAAFGERHATVGQNFTLFAGGVRVGQLQVESTTNSTALCTQRPAGVGIAEMVPSAGALSHFLALDDRVAGPREYRPLMIPEWDYLQRDAGVSLSAQVIPEVRARWPQRSWDTYRTDMQALSPEGGLDRAFATTFLVDDQREIGPADSTSYSIFVMGEREPNGAFRRTHTRYQLAGNGNKAVPLFYQQLDFDQDGSSEVILEVLGESSRWMVVLARQGDEWVNVFEDPCGS